MVSSGATAGSGTDWKKMKVQELRDELTTRGLDSTGLKSVLIERLEAAASAEDVPEETTVDGEKEDLTKLDINDGPNVNASTEKAAVPAASVSEAENGGKLAAAAVVQQDGNQMDETSRPAEPLASASNGKAAPKTDLEKKQNRAERFGLELMVTEGEKRRLRAARFGGPAESKAAGGTSTMSPTLKEDEAAKRKARAARFGIDEKPNSPSSISPSSDESRKRARLARFGLEVKADPLEAEKKRLRAERFGMTSEGKTDSKSEKPISVEQPVAS